MLDSYHSVAVSQSNILRTTLEDFMGQEAVKCDSSSGRGSGCGSAVVNRTFLALIQERDERWQLTIYMFSKACAMDVVEDYCLGI